MYGELEPVTARMGLHSVKHVKKPQNNLFTIHTYENTQMM